MKKTVLTLALLALLLGACRAESITRLRIAPEGTATVISEFAFDEEALAIIGDLDDTPEDVLRALSEFIDPSALPVAAAGVEPEQFVRGDLQGIRVTIPGLDPDEVAAQLSSGDSIIDDITLSLSDGTLRMAGRTRDVSDFERARLLSLVPGDLSEILSLVLQIEVPGEVSSHNADRVLADGLLEWDLLTAVTEGEGVDVSVAAAVDPDFRFVDLEGEPFQEPEPVGQSSTAWWVAVIPFLLAGVVSWIIIRLIRRRRRLPEIEGFTPPEIASDDERSSNSPRI
ncbi:MAG: hypothetical protein EX267_01410 [Acidimicrobiia bacterium]|nr:MAG: hypothetical protein EX267_01410 [Acidimicrobiia bacterium]